jgi:hypothetical protein
MEISAKVKKKNQPKEEEEEIALYRRKGLGQIQIHCWARQGVGFSLSSL